MKIANKTSGTLFFQSVETAWGTAGFIYHIATDDEGKSGLTNIRSNALILRIFTACPDVGQLAALVKRNFPDGFTVPPSKNRPGFVTPLISFLQYYYNTRPAGKRTLMVKNVGTPQEIVAFLDWSAVGAFDRLVLRETLKIRPGGTLTYGQLAAKIGRPRAARAVGAALGRNPWPVLIPCHRVVGKDGKLTGFSGFGGVRAKQRMLDMERKMVRT